MQAIAIDQIFFRLFTQGYKQKQVSKIARCEFFSFLLQVKAVIIGVEIISSFYTVLTKYVHWLKIMLIVLQCNNAYLSKIVALLKARVGFKLMNTVYSTIESKSFNRRSNQK